MDLRSLDSQTVKPNSPSYLGLQYCNGSPYHGNEPLIRVMTVMNSSFSLFESHEDYEVMSWEKQP